jgi:hypothetical protein
MTHTKDEALQMCLEYIETDAHERKYVRHAIKQALAAQPAPVQPVKPSLWEQYHAAQPVVQEPEYVYTCNGCDTLYREDDVSCDCTVNGLMEFTRHILAPDTTPPAPAVPDAMTSADIQEHIEYVAGWNECRQAMLEMTKNRSN